MRSSVTGFAVLCIVASCVAPASVPNSRARSIETGDLPVAGDAEARRLLTDVRQADSAIRVELRYATSHNFTGAPLPGYEGNRALLRHEAARALARASEDLRGEGFALLVLDAYRPVRATAAMMAWTKATGREDLVRDGYVATRSRHNLGAAIDLTLVDATGQPLDMGTQFDSFSTAAHTANASGLIAENRQRLVRAMERYGFANYEKEWWHFSYPIADERRMDLVIR